VNPAARRPHDKNTPPEKWVAVSFSRDRAGEAKLRVEIAAVTANQVDIARKAFRRYGRGRHAANLNFGDCFAYVLAKEKSAPLLFKGHDFGRTDVMAAPY
jgi:uncharacterized protein with PIN domain